MTPDDFLSRLEQLLTVYTEKQKEIKEIERQRSEQSLKYALDLIENNRKANFELLQYFSKFIDSNATIQKDDN